MYRLETVHLGESANNGIGVVGVNFNPVPTPAGLFRRNERRAAAGKGIKYDSIAFGAIHYCVGNERHRLHRRVHCQFGISVGTESIHARVIPNVCAVAPETPQINVVDMRRSAVFEHENQFMLRAIKAPHPGI